MSLFSCSHPCFIPISSDYSSVRIMMIYLWQCNWLLSRVTLRFLVGVFNGIIGTTKAILGDVSDDSNQAVGLALLSVGWVSTINLSERFMRCVRCYRFCHLLLNKIEFCFREAGFYLDQRSVVTYLNQLKNLLSLPRKN